MNELMKKLLLLLLLSLGLIGISYADDSQVAIEREIAEFKAELALALIPPNANISGDGWSCNTTPRQYRLAVGGRLCIMVLPTDSVSIGCNFCNYIIKVLKQMKVVLENKINEVEDDEFKELKINMIEQQIFEIEAEIAVYKAKSDYFFNRYGCHAGYKKSGNFCIKYLGN